MAMVKAAEVRALLTALLADSGATWTERAGLVCFRLCREGMVWETACRCLDGRVLIYGRYPFSVGGGPDFGPVCSRVNSQVVEGALFLPPDGRPVFRTGARLYELWDARTRVADALEYNGAVVARFWGDVQRCQMSGGFRTPG